MRTRQEKARFEARARVAKALGHPARLVMLDELSRGERCVCELRALVGCDMSTVSRHLAVLRAAGIVGDQKRGNQVFYRLLCPCIPRFLACIDSVLRVAARAQWKLVRSAAG